MANLILTPAKPVGSQVVRRHGAGKVAKCLRQIVCGASTLGSRADYLGVSEPTLRSILQACGARGRVVKLTDEERDRVRAGIRAWSAQASAWARWGAGR